MSEISGVTFPIPKSYIPRFFDQGKTIFIKPASTFKKIRSGLKFIFYQSQEDTGYVGEAIIKKITIAEDPFSFYNLYGDSIFLTQAELEKYIETNNKWIKIHYERKSKPRKKKWLAIELDSFLKYDEPIKPKQFVPIGGKYIMNDSKE